MTLGQTSMKDSLQIARVNSVAIFDNPEDMLSHVEALQALEKQRAISLLLLSVKEIISQPDETPALGVAKNLFDTLSWKTHVGCANPVAWFKNRSENKTLIKLNQTLSEQKTAAQLESFLARHNKFIKAQITRLVAIEQQENFLITLIAFHEINRQDQPMVAGILHRLVKGTPAHFRILSVGEPTLFRKDSLGEEGIQLNHDYIEINMARGI